MKMPFGKFKSFDLAEIPDDYLDWLRLEIELREPLKSAVNREFATRESGYCEISGGTLDAGKVKAIYRNLAFQYHPDRIGGNGEVMKGINLFYEALQPF